MATSFSDASVRDYYWTFNDDIVYIQDLIADDQYKMFTLDVTTLNSRLVLMKIKLK